MNRKILSTLLIILFVVIASGSFLQAATFKKTSTLVALNTPPSADSFEITSLYPETEILPQSFNRVKNWDTARDVEDVTALAQLFFRR